MHNLNLQDTNLELKNITREIDTSLQADNSTTKLTDKRRLYIYMQGETKHGKCEVTWVVVNNNYYTRILDNIP